MQQCATTSVTGTSQPSAASGQAPGLGVRSAWACSSQLPGMGSQPNQAPLSAASRITNDRSSQKMPRQRCHVKRQCVVNA